jgi:DUF4097 and DUF4098 domain-containing protein YvlB
MKRARRAACLAAGVVLITAILAAGETRKEFRFTVGPRATVSIINQYGPVSVKPGAGSQVVVTATLYSDKVEIDQGQSGSRVNVLSHLLPGATAETGRVDYEVAVPSDASVTLHSMTGPLRAEKLHGDVTLEGATANMDVRDISDAHVHVKTLNGPVTLTNIRDGHVEITSVTGDVMLVSVSGPWVQVNSSSGRISYDGDFGNGGAPPDASIDVTARSVKGKVENDFLLEPKHTPFVIKAGSAFAGTLNKAASSVKLLSFSGKIHLKKR